LPQFARTRRLSEFRTTVWCDGESCRADREDEIEGYEGGKRWLWTVVPFEIVTMINRAGIVYLGGASPGTCTPLKLYFSPDTDTRKRALHAGSGARGLGGGVRVVDTRAFVDFSVHHSSRERTPQLCHARSTNNAAGKKHRSAIKYPSKPSWNIFVPLEFFLSELKFTLQNLYVNLALKEQLKRFTKVLNKWH